MEISSIRRNAAVAAKGMWVGDIPGMPGVELEVRGLSSLAAINCRRKLERQVEKKDRERGGGFKPEVEQRITRQVLHEAILLNWRGLTDGGKPLDYTPEFAGQLLLDPNYDVFAGAVTWAAGIADSDNTEVAEEQAGNSKKPSSGN